MNDINWEDLRIFRCVARSGSLSAATEAAGASAATIGRKILRLERKLGASLFDKTQSGYIPTLFGLQLLERTQSMALSASELTKWRDRVFELPLISVSAPPEIQWLLCNRIRELWEPEDAFRIRFEDKISAHRLEHNKSTLLITPNNPTSGNLKVSGLGAVTSRAYCSTTFDQVKDCNWIGFRQDAEAALAQPFDIAENDLWVTIWAASFDGVITLVQNNAGRAILPEFIGEADPKMCAVNDEDHISLHHLFLVSHSDESARTEIATLKRRLITVLKRCLSVDA